MMPCFIATILAGAACPAFAQDQPKKFKEAEVKKIHVGFQTFQDDERTVYKAGLWTPVYVTLFGGTDGIQQKPNYPRPPYIEIETVDSEEVGTQIRVPVVAVPPNESQMFIGYVKTGHLGRNLSEIKVTLHANGREYTPRSIEPTSSLNINAHLYLVLGSKMDDLSKAVKRMDKQQQPNEKEFDFGAETGLRNVVFETNADRLPDMWFGYNGIDLIVLTTEKKKFLDELQAKPEKVKALSQWVRRGGRLIIPVAPANQDKIAALLENKAWQPPIPVIPSRIAEKSNYTRLDGFEQMGGGEPYQRFDPKNPEEKLNIPIATFDTSNAANNWEVIKTNAVDPNARPLIARVCYGLGQIVYVAVSLEDTTFFEWKNGKHKFLESLISQFAPTSPSRNEENEFRRMGMAGSNDLATDLINQLDNFDVKVIPFGYVALFIVLYILVVGPLDFFLLKYVFKRLEWTWITFPAVVLAVSVIAYFAAYALKGRDLKINKVDIVDFDLRTSLDKKGVPTQPYAYGQTFFTILSPRIQNYTIGVEPNAEFWGEKADKVKSVDLIGWMGRPSGGMNDMGRGGSSSFFRKPYLFAEDASALQGVPIPVWTTKAFSASWEQRLPKTPFKAELVYHHEKEIRLSGKLENHLGVDLVDTWILFDGRSYPIAGGLKRMDKEALAKDIELTTVSAQEIKAWAASGQVNPQDGEVRIWTSNPATLIKQMLFIGKVDVNNSVRNHLLRPLDLGWRVDKIENLGRRDRQTREAVLFGRTRFASGNAESITADKANPVATKIWLQDIPDEGKTRPELIGTMNQDTFVRIILPIRSAEE
jgi:hypothetical protein